MISKPSIECVNVGIDIFPVAPPPVKAKPKLPLKLLLILKKYKYNWRISQLAKPTRRKEKFVSKAIEPIRYEKRAVLKLPHNTRFYADQMSRPLIRYLIINKRLYGKQNGKQYNQQINKNIAKSWASIYNFYKKNQIDKKRRQQLREAKLHEKKKKTVDNEKLAKLAQPKPEFSPPKKEKPAKFFEDFDHLDVLAAPVTREIPKPRELKVNPAALTYEPTENILKLAAVPERFKNIPPPIEPGIVLKSALRYNITPRIEELAAPKQRKEKALEDEDFDPWAISKNALKYKPTPRILELAKPVERD